MVGDSNLKIFTLGRFLVSKNDDIISDETTYSNKLWELFQYLLSHPGKILPMEKIIDELEFDLEMLDAKNALENRVYRLRKLLAKGEKYQAGKYIIFKQGGYSLNWQADYWCDVLEFKRRYYNGEELATNGDKEDALNEYLPALDLYKGDYLNTRANKHWVVAPRIQYKQIYLDTLKKATNLLEEFNEYKEIENLCRDAIQHEPFEETPHYLLIISLINQGHKREAKLHYEFVKSLYADQVEEPFPDLFEKFNSDSNYKITLNNNGIIKHECKDKSIYDIDKIKSELGISYRVSDKKFIPAEICCDFADFLVKNQQRYDGGLYMASIALEFCQGEEEDKIRELYINKLKSIIIRNMRSSDVICEWTEQQFIVFFSSIQEDKVKDILSRLKKSYYDVEDIDGTVLNTNYRKL
ncbi:MAG: AfsR/SARP family transcriptional regulator [Bacillota bacterium]